MWTDVELSCADDVTVTDMYCTNGVFQVKSTDQVVAYPEVKASFQTGRMVAAIDKNVILMDNDEENSFQLLNYDYHIDCIATVNDGQIVVCGLSDGHVHGSLINGIPVFDLSIPLEDTSHNASRTFVGIYENDRKYYLMTCSGSLYVLEDLDDDLNLQQNLSQVNNESSGDRTMVYDRTLLSTVSIKQVLKPSFAKLNVLAFTILGMGKGSKSVTYCDSNFVYQQTIDECIANPDQKGIKVKLPRSFGVIRKIINLENFILLLTMEGSLYQFAPETKCVVRVNGAGLEDILVLENDLNEVIELMALQRHQETEQKSLKIMNYPEMKTNYELMISEHCWLVSQPKSSMNMYYMQGEFVDDEELPGDKATNLPNAIELKQIAELHPMQRFKKLISRGLIDEAAAFAKQMNLSLDLIHEHRVHIFVIQIANERNPEALQKIFKDFMDLLRSITNLPFLVNLRNIDIPDRGLKEKFLKFLSGKLSNNNSKDVEDSWKVAGEIEEQLHRLDTLKIIDPYSLDAQNFIQESNLLKCCLQMLKTNVQDASLVWSRHTSAIVPFITNEDLPKILQSIPKDTEMIDILHWLRHITPGLIQVHSQFMPMAVKWCVQKAKALESTAHWPENGLEFMKLVHAIFSSREFIVTDSDSMYKSNVDTMNQMVSVLQELAELKAEFNLTVKLDSYSDEDLDKTALNLLQRVQINHLRKLLQDFIVPLFLRHNQSASSALAQYIQFLVENRKFTTQWQEKAVLVVQMLTNEDERLQSALLVLDNAPVPWIAELKPLVAYGKSSHPLAAEIVAKHQLQVVKMIRIRYQYPANGNEDTMQLIYRIVKLQRETMVEEIRAIVKVMPKLRQKIFMYCVSHLIQHEQLEGAITFFDDFNEWSESKEEVEVLFTLFANSFKNATEMYMQNVVHFLNIISNRSVSRDGQLTIEDLHTVYKLRSCYGICLAKGAAELMHNGRDILDAGIESVLEELRMKVGNEDVLEQAFDNLTKLCGLLKLDCVSGVIRICQRVNTVAFTFAMASLLLELEVSPVSRRNYKEYLQLGVLILAQVIENLSLAKHQDFPMFSLAYEILSSCTSYAKLDVVDLHDLLPIIRIGKNMYKCVDTNRWFVQNKKLLLEGLGQLFAVSALKDASRRESTRKSRRESYSVFNETMTEIAAPTEHQAVAMTGGGVGASTNVDLVINCLSIMIEIMVLKENSVMSQRFRKFFSEDFEEMDVELLTKGFIQAVNQLYQNKVLAELHLIFHEMLKSQKRLGLNIINEQYALAVNKKLLCVQLAKEEVDIQDCYLILTKAHPRELLSSLEANMKSIVEKHNYYALAEYFNFSHNRLEDAAKFKTLRVKYKHFAEIKKLNPSVKLSLETFNASALPHLKIELDTLKKLCHEFECNYQDVVIGQILQILKTKELKFHVVQDEMEVEKIKILTTVESILELCVPLVNEIAADRVPFFTKRLIKFAETVDSYFYEMFLAIIEILTIRDSLPQQMEPWKTILVFLQDKMVTRRRVRPNQAEMDWYSKTQNEASVLPKIAKYRFPFFRLNESLADTLGEEINVENCVSWFPLISAYMDTVEEIDHHIEFYCSRAVKNSIGEWKMQNDDNRNEDVWHLVPENNDFLQAILRLVQNVKWEYKAFCILYYTMNHMPEGADQVEAAYECYNFVMEHEAQLMENDKSKEAVAKIRRKYPMLKTQHLLHVYKMTDDALMELIEKPQDLIASLYLHSVVLKDIRPDVKGLVTAIAEVHNLPLHSIEELLLRKMLRLDDGAGRKWDVDEDNVDESCVILDPSDPFVVSEQLLRNLDQLSNFEITNRVNYILSNWPETTRISFLVSRMHTLQSEMDGGNGAGGAEAANNLQKFILLYECLAMVQVSDESKLMIDAFKQEEFMTCKIVYLLSKINFQYDKAPVTAQTLMHGKPIDVLKVLWKNYAKTKELIEAMLLICLRYDINVKEIWDSVLKKMVALHMKEQLRSVIDLLGTRKDLALLSSLPVAIQYVVMEPLKSATKEKSPEQETRLGESLLMLQTCRMTSKLDLLSIGEKFISLERPCMAAVVLPFMNKIGERRKLIELLEPFKNEKLKRDIDELCELGLMSMITRLAIQILYRKREEDDEEEDEDDA